MEGKVRRKNDIIVSWLLKIELSNLTISDFFEANIVPFSRAQYYIYKKRFKQFGRSGLEDKRKNGGNKKLNSESEKFIKKCLDENLNVSNLWLREQLIKRYGCAISPSGISRALRRICPERIKEKRESYRIEKQEVQINQFCGFELIIALAYHLGWPQMTSNAIVDAVNELKETENYYLSKKYSDKKGRDSWGRFTSKYNQRKDIRENRFASVSKKRLTKNWGSMNIFRDNKKAIERKSLAILSLPVVTMNGSIRTVNAALGQALKHITGFDYKQSTLTKYLNELKYLGISMILLQEAIRFWNKCWGNEISRRKNKILLCYYIDGNTKPIWSNKRVKQNKVTMTGRVMGCLEQVFIHDCYGHPIYFETYSGNAPCGEYTLELFDKIEEVIKETIPGARVSVCRVLVMDGANNSVKTLRAFASQDKYHYITPLDTNQWNERKVERIGKALRYKYGDAVLQEVKIELEDSTEPGYLVKVRAIKIDWDNGKRTVLLTSLPVEIVGAGEIVRSYFNRWPAQELQFKSMKATACLHRVAGYGKQEIEDEKILEKQKHSANRISKLKKILEIPLKEIGDHEEAIAALISKELRLRKRSKIDEGKRLLPEKDMEKYERYKKEIKSHEKAITKIEKENLKDFKLLRKHQREWLRLQGKEKVYKVDVELDQILTFHRVCLANLYAYFIKYFLGGEPLSVLNMLHKIIYLQGRIEETINSRNIILDFNKKDKLMMNKLSIAIEKINALNIYIPKGKKMLFSFGDYGLK